MTDDNYFISNEEYIGLVKQAADEIELLRAENEKLQDEIIILRKEITKLQKETVKQRFALIDIQCKAHDILRPIPFQDEDDE